MFYNCDIRTHGSWSHQMEVISRIANYNGNEVEKNMIELHCDYYFFIDVIIIALSLL